MGRAASTNASAQEFIYLNDLPVAYYLYDANGLASGPYFIHANHLGAPLKVTDSAGGTLVNMQYGAFGERTVLSSSIEPPRLGLPGQIYTPNGWFVHNYFREYDPSTGRYLQSDPIGLSGGINPYAYVKGNPVRFIDPFGLTQCDVDVALDLAATSLDGKPLPAPKNPRLPTPFEPWQSPDPVIQEVDNELKGYSGESNFDRKSHNYVNTVINSKYYECLSDKDALDLFDLIVHEGIHRSLPFDSPLQPDPIRTDYVYQATGTMIADLKDRFLRGRQKCRCCRN